MFNFIKKAPSSSPKQFVRYTSCQHPLGFLWSFVLIDSRAIYSKHNLDPSTFLLKPFQWLSTALRIESKFLNRACITWPLTLHQLLLPQYPCPVVSAFQSAEYVSTPRLWGSCCPQGFVRGVPFPGWPLFIHGPLCLFILQVSTYDLLPQGLPQQARSGHTLPASVTPWPSPS